MAERRMFSKSIIDSDMFLDMPSSAQNLYFHLGMRADDEGFINNPKKIQKIIGGGDDDVKILLAKNYLILFETGVIVVTHWKQHNYIQKDRFKPTSATFEKALLVLDKSNVYSLDTECIQDVYSLDTQVRLGKVSLGKVTLSNEQKDQKQNHIFFTSFEHFVNFMRANYQNKEIIKTQDKYNKQPQIISVSTNGLLYNKKDNQTFQATRAKEIWQSLYGLYLKGELNIEEEITPC